MKTTKQQLQASIDAIEFYIFLARQERNMYETYNAYESVKETEIQMNNLQYAIKVLDEIKELNYDEQ